MTDIELISRIISVIGIVMLLLSIGLYIKRTGDKTALTRFWASKGELSRLELVINSVGLLCVIAGLLLPRFI